MLRLATKGIDAPGLPGRRERHPTPARGLGLLHYAPYYADPGTTEKSCQAGLPDRAFGVPRFPNRPFDNGRDRVPELLPLRPRHLDRAWP
jgi:hypothetical protein